MDTRQLAAFCEVVERRSFSEAAARLGVTQPAVSPEVRVELSVFDTQSVVELVAERRLELGIVGAARRHRSVSFEPFFRDEVILACPPGHRFAGRTVALADLAGGPLILMQRGAGVR